MGEWAAPVGAWGILALALIHAAIYVYLLPPWQHYDEPNHFEVAWLIAQRGQIPQPGDFDQSMRRSVAQSMIEHRFFHNLGFLPDLNAVDQPIWIGSYSQLGDPPLYYLLAALPLKLFAAASIETQLVAVRWLSVLLYLLSILSAWGTVRELTPPGSRLRWFVPLVMALLPAFTELMTAVNSDVGAVAFFSLFLWACAVLIRRGFSWGVALWALVGAGLCFATKSNVMIAVPLLIVAWSLALVRGRQRWLLGAAAGLAGLITLAAVFRGDSAAFWYADAPNGGAALVQAPDPGFGGAAFEVNRPDARFVQMLPPETVQALRGQVVTLGAWAWSSTPGQVDSPALVVDGGRQTAQSTWNVDATPRFQSFSVALPADAQRAWLVLAAPAGRAVSYDGVVLCAGAYPADSIPVIEGQTVLWGGSTCENGVRNPSAEERWLAVVPWADALVSRFFPDGGRLSLMLYTALDAPGVGEYYRATALNLLRSFWAVFSWGQIPLLGGRPYQILGAFTLLGIIGGLWLLARLRSRLPWGELIFLGLALGAVWLETLVRGSIYVFYSGFIPSARYAFPVIIPTVLILAAGWLAWDAPARRWLRLPDWLLPMIYLVGLLFLDTWAVISVLSYYNSIG